MANYFLQAIQERHENSLLKAEIEKLREENKGLRAIANNPSCPSCGFASPSNIALPAEEQQLRIENAKLRAEVILIRKKISCVNSQSKLDHLIIEI